MSRFWLYLMVGTLAYWIGGCAIWIVRERAAVRRGGGTWVETGSGNAMLEVKGEIKLLGLAAWALLPPALVGLVLRLL